MEMSPDFSRSRKKLTLDYRLICFILVLIIAAMLAIWKPWAEAAKNADRVIEVTGEATVSAEPDEFVFYPSYKFTNANKQQALDAMIARSNELVKGLKDLGLEDKNIKTNSSGYQEGRILPTQTPESTSYTLQLTITVTDRDQAQKVQTYLVKTTPDGAVSPYARFSDTRSKELETQARDMATKNARAKADQSAGNLGFKILGVKSVADGSGFGTIEPYAERALDSTTSKPETLAVQPGQNELNYSVRVIYFIK